MKTGVIMLILFLFLLFLPLLTLRLDFRYARAGQNDEFTVRICLFGGKLCCRVKLPFVKVERKGSRLSMKIRARLETMRARGLSGEKAEIRLPGPWRMAEMAARSIYVVKKYLPVFHYLLRRIRLLKFCWSTELGTGDPFSTGLAAGAAWSFKGALASFVCRFFSAGAARPEVAVRPNFFQPCFNTAIECIFEVRIGHIIITGIKALFIKIK
ncbi:MAG: DUF2953 domain-containing protein [Peptococcaceae bacterium]|nr:DUF2953 domain-containing protein [Peptococcaceae bacterium]